MQCIMSLPHNTHPHLITPNLYGIGEEFVAFASGVATGGGVEAVFVQGAYYMAFCIQPAIAHGGTGMGAPGCKGENTIVSTQEPYGAVCHGGLHELTGVHAAESNILCMVP